MSDRETLRKELEKALKALAWNYTVLDDGSTQGRLLKGTRGTAEIIIPINNPYSQTTEN